MKFKCPNRYTKEDVEKMKCKGFSLAQSGDELTVSCPGVEPRINSHECYDACFGTDGLFTQRGVSGHPPCTIATDLPPIEIIGLSPVDVTVKRMIDGMADM